MSRWIYHSDQDGRRIKPPPRGSIGYTVMPVRPTPDHALSSPTVISGDDEQREAQQRALDAAMQTLNDEEHAVVKLQQERREHPRRETIQLGELQRYLDADWFLVHRSARSAVVTKTFVSAPSCEEIAERLHLTVRQVRRRVESAHRKLKVATW